MLNQFNLLQQALAVRQPFGTLFKMQILYYFCPLNINFKKAGIFK
jgi:hypothetical protein